MIPSKYLFPVVALVLVWAGSLFGVYHWVTALNNPGAPRAFQNSLNEQLNTTLDDNYAYRLRQFERRIENDAKARFRPIMPVLMENEEMLKRFSRERRSYLSRLQKQSFNPKLARHYLKQLSHLGTNTALAIATNNASLLNARGNEFDLTYQQIQAFNADAFEKAYQIDGNQLVKDPPGSILVFETRLSALELQLKVFFNQQMQFLIDVSGGILIACHFGPDYFPAPVNADFIVLRGSKETIPFGFVKRPSQELSLILNGDTLQQGIIGLFDVPIATQQLGEHEIELTLVEHNQLTGFSRNWDFKYAYTVLDEQ